MKNLLLLVLLFTLGSCGTTQLVTVSSSADIYVNNEFKGKGQASIKRSGPPQKSHIDVRYHGAQIGEMDIKREVKFSTVIIGLYTYGIRFFLSWRYPEIVIIPTKEINGNQSFDHNKSIWDLPPGEWKK